MVECKLCGVDVCEDRAYYCEFLDEWVCKECGGDGEE